MMVLLYVAISCASVVVKSYRLQDNSFISAVCSKLFVRPDSLISQTLTAIKQTR